MNDETNKTSVFFDDYSKKYDIKRVNGYFAKNLAWFINYLPSFLDGQKVVDVGCGTGNLCISISTIYKNTFFCGVDISSRMIEKAKEKCKYNMNVDFRVGDVHNLLFEKESFDYILNTISFHHYEEPKKVISEFHRILKPQGKLFLMDSITNPLPFSFMPFVWDLTERNKCYTKHLSSSKFAKLFNESEFKKIEYNYYTRLFPARHILCIAQK